MLWLIRTFIKLCFSSVRKKFSPFRVERCPKKAAKIYPVYEEEVEWREMENLSTSRKSRGELKIA